MKSSKLFSNRLLKDLKFQFSVFKTIADWTIWLYLIIPSIVIFIFIYRSWWYDIPSWIEGFPLFTLFFILYLLSWNGHIRTYLEEADKVFLIKRYESIWMLKKWGYSYSLINQSIRTTAIIFILLPFLLYYYSLDWHRIISLLLFFISLKVSLMLVKYYLRKIESRWKKIGVGILVFMSYSWFTHFIYTMFDNGLLLVVYISAWTLLFLSIYLSLTTIRKVSSLDYEIEMEQERKTSIIKAIFMAAPEIEKPHVSKRTKPFLFRKSKRILKKRTPANGFIEVFIKIFIRNYSYVSGYLVLINTTTAAFVLIPPIWFRIFLFLVFLLMMNSWLTLIWDKIFNTNPLMKKYTESDTYFSARKKAVMGMFILAIVLLSVFILVGITLSTKWGISYDS
ncbi:ABC transporter permease [Bacillus sp. PS06]|uniref:ABC transporter permease n=1 Tax=Bacillus sp. PS06 TaxID=2764176 RepID=UPI001786BA8C|nr:ABC transporter permease [Bacillus sp. PS06]MBD8067814.1 ABC transporter permease [Bacillus sp. PS06]